MSYNENLNIKYFDSNSYNNLKLINRVLKEINSDIIILSGTYSACNYNESFYNFLKQLLNICKTLFIIMYDTTPKNNIDLKNNFPDGINFIYPCPHATPGYTDKNIFYWQSYGIKPHIDKSQYKNIRQKLGCKDNEKIIFMPISAWVYRFYPITKIITNYYSYIRSVLSYILHDLPTHLVIVDPVTNKQEFHFKQNRMYIHLYPLLHPKFFEELLLSSDLFIGEYCMQSSLIKALSCSIPVILLENKWLKDPLNLNYIPFDLKPIFENMLLEEFKPVINSWILTNNRFSNEKYFQLLYKCEMFDVKNNKNIFYDLLFNEKTKNKFISNQRKYMESISNIPFADQIINKFYC